MMGCLYSRRTLGDHLPTVFHVTNVDEFGNHIIDGKIKVARAGVVYYPRDGNTILWPLRSLRRYGWDSALFSFEAGRRAPTGPGIYAFKCDRAQELFNVLQAQFAMEENLSNAIRENQANPSICGSRRAASIDGYLEPVAPTTIARIRTMSASPGGGVRVRLDSIDSCSETQSPSPSTSSPLTIIDATSVMRSESKMSGLTSCEVTEQTSELERNNNRHEYSNGIVTCEIDGFVDVREDEENANHVYMNISPGTEAKHLAPLRQVVSIPTYPKPLLANLAIPEELDPDENQHCYANLDLPERVSSTRVINRAVNYAVLDLYPTGNPATMSTSTSAGSVTPGSSSMNGSSSSVLPSGAAAPIPPDSPISSSTLSSYVTIDFEKTTALSHSVCPNRDYDREASRKTRHNSTMNLPPD